MVTTCLVLPLNRCLAPQRISQSEAIREFALSLHFPWPRILKNLTPGFLKRQRQRHVRCRRLRIQLSALKLLPPPPPPPQRPTLDVDPIPRPVAVLDAPVRRSTPDPNADAQVKAAAQNLFAAKQPEKPENRKGFAIAIGLLTVISVAGIGGYFWWQLQPKGATIAKPALPPPPVAQPSAPPPTMAAVSPAPPPAAPLATTPTANAPISQSSSAGTIKPSPPAKSATDDTDDDDIAAPTSRQTRPRRAANRTEPEDDGPIRVTRQPLRVDPAVARGFEAFSRGDAARSIRGPLKAA
jgi:hypothetical protein